MYLGSSNVGELENKTQNLPLQKAIVLLASPDLFSECLGQLLSIKFMDYDVVIIPNPKGLMDSNLADIKLVLLYNIAPESMPESLKLLRDVHPEAQVGIFVDSSERLEPHIADLVEQRIVHGVLPLNLRLDVCMAAIDLLMKGGEHFPAALLRRLASDPAAADRSLYSGSTSFTGRQPSGSADGDSPQVHFNSALLTTREVQILDLICKGTQNKIIADKLHLSENTVKVHVRNIYKKMKVRNRTEAASQYFHSDISLEADPLRRWHN